MQHIRLPGLADQDDATAISICINEIKVLLGKAKAKADVKRLEATLPDIHKRVTDYITKRGDASLLAPSPFPRSKPTKAKAKKKKKKKKTQSTGDLLYSRYASGKGPDKAILEVVASATSTHCPYCGLRLRRKPKLKRHDRDHILPRSVYPEFSVLRANLVHSCDDCNDEKGNQCLNAGGERIFVHPYFDVFLENKVIHASAAVVSDSIVVQFTSSTDLHLHERQLLDRHMEALDIGSRAMDDARTVLHPVLAQHISSWKKDGDIDAIREAVRASAVPYLAARPNDPVGLALEAAASGDIEALLAAATVAIV